MIIDNASFHPQSRIEKLVKQARCQVIFLPVYSPDFNKIEKFWGRLKNRVSQIINDFDSLVNSVNQAFRELS